MIAWWQSLTTLEHVLLYVAVPATLILLIQTVLLFVGGVFDSDGDGDAGAGDGDLDGGAGLDTDFDTDFDLDGDLPEDASDLDMDTDTDGGQGHALAGLHLFTVRGVVAFFTLFGWSGLCFLQLGFPAVIAVFLAVPVGLAGMVGIALILREAMKLQYDGTLNLQNAVGLTGSVYLTVPALRAAPGKVNVTVQEQLREFEAVTDRGTPIPTGSPIRVIGLAEGNLLLVESIDSEDQPIDWCDTAIKMREGFKP